MDCSVVVAGDRASDNEKQNVSVILVPESVLLALRNSSSDSTDEAQEIGNPPQASSTDARQDRDCEPLPDNNGASEQIPDGNLSPYLLSEQQSQLIVIEPGDWFVDVNFTNAQGREPNPMSKQTSESSNRTTNLLSPQLEDNVVQSLTFAADSQTSDAALMCKFDNCGKSFATEKDASIHRKSHEKSNAYHCVYPECPWSFATPYKLRRHYASHRQAKSFKCQYPGCEVSCSTSYNLKVHEKFHTQSNYSHCDECNEDFNGKLAFQKHQRAVHKIEPRFCCTVPKCGKRFHNEGARKVHLRTHARLDFVCGVEGCGKRFKQPAVFREHYMSRHTALRPFKCGYPSCKWEFTTRAKLRRHEQTHTDEKRHWCPYEGCNARFFRQEHVRSHMKVHNAENEKKKEENELEAPIEFNLNDYVYYFCPHEDCGSLFTSYGGAKQHIQKLHMSDAIQPVTVASSGNEILDTVTFSETGKCEEVAGEIVSCEVNKEPCTQSHAASSPQSILKTLMQAEEGAGAQSSETLASESFSAPQVQLNFVTTSSNAANIGVAPVVTSQMASASAQIDPLQFLLADPLQEPTASFVPTTPTKATMCDSEPLGFINLHQSIYSSQTSAVTADSYLSFNDCVQTVDPNVVMSLPSSGSAASAFNQVSASLRSEASDDNEGRSLVATGSDGTSGSARTDCYVYRRAKAVKKWNTGCAAASNHDSTAAVALSATVNSFDFSEGESSPEKQVRTKMTNSGGFKNVLSDRHFSGSTINLSDLV